MSEPAHRAVDIDHLKTWIGKTEQDEDRLAARHAMLMAATLGVDGAAVRNAGVLPPLWHWTYFLSAAPAGELGPDGHPARGGFLPPVPLRNRMWAGGRVRFVEPLPLDAVARKLSTVKDVSHKVGRSGDLVFVTVEHRLEVDERLCLVEEHDIVYKGPGANPERTRVAGPDAPRTEAARILRADSTLLFRYSALTFNGHRIHYDADYCRREEGYAAPVIHGPLNATLLAGLAQELSQRPLREFSYRGHNPAVLGDALHMHVDRTEDGFALASRFADGAICMSARAR